MSRVFAYCRVSTLEQTTENQRREIEAAGFAIRSQRLIEEHISGSVAASERPGFIRLLDRMENGTVAKLAMRQPFVLFKGLTFQKLCLPGAFRPGDHHNKMLRPGLCVVHASPQYL